MPKGHDEAYYRTYQPLEFALFSAMLGVAASLVFFTTVQILTVNQAKISEGLPLRLYGMLFVGYFCPAMTLACAFDRRHPKGRRVFFHLILYLVMWEWATRTIDILGELNQDIPTSDLRTLVMLMLVITFIWPLTHLVFRGLARAPR